MLLVSCTRYTLGVKLRVSTEIVFVLTLDWVKTSEPDSVVIFKFTCPAKSLSEIVTLSFAGLGNTFMELVLGWIDFKADEL